MASEMSRAQVKSRPGPSRSRPVPPVAAPLMVLEVPICQAGWKWRTVWAASVLKKREYRYKGLPRSITRTYMNPHTAAIKLTLFSLTV